MRRRREQRGGWAAGEGREKEKRARSQPRWHARPTPFLVAGPLWSSGRVGLTGCWKALLWGASRAVQGTLSECLSVSRRRRGAISLPLCLSARGRPRWQRAILLFGSVFEASDSVLCVPSCAVGQDGRVCSSVLC